MPRFFFHVRDSVELLDTEGVELASTEMARSAAIRAAGEALRDLGGKFWDAPEWRMWVTNESGATVCALTFKPEIGLE